jgi:hypothetical protein
MKQLEEKAMLVKLSISQWTARKYDKKISDEVADMKGADKDAGRYNKVLVAQEAIKEVNQVAMEARMFHYEQTLPWFDDGFRILTSKNYDNYMTKMRQFGEKFEIQTTKFTANYPALVEAARVKLNGMFNADDYPSIHEIKRKYRWSVDISPIPVAKDFRVGLAGGEVDRIAKEIEARLKEAQVMAMKDLWSRLHDVVSKMAEKLRDEGSIFRDSLVGNIADLVRLLPALNMNEDPELEAMRRKIESRLCSYNPQDLRESKRERSAAVKDADAILKAMAGYIGGDQK